MDTQIKITNKKRSKDENRTKYKVIPKHRSLNKTQKNKIQVNKRNNIETT